MESKNTIGQSFEKAVKATDDIALGFCSGLQALGSNSVVIKVQNNRSLNGSVDIDTTTSSLYPQDARWDYTVGYDNRAYFVEVHPANTSNVKEMIHKKEWLDNWLNIHAPELKKIKAEAPYYWVPSGKVAILRNSPQFKRIALNHILIVNKVEIE